ncbi:MAG: hypothetical protein AAFU38_12405 [Bacteroidota bacterium]
MSYPTYQVERRERMKPDTRGNREVVASGLTRQAASKLAMSLRAEGDNETYCFGVWPMPLVDQVRHHVAAETITALAA